MDRMNVYRDNINIFNDTLSIIEKGYYNINGTEKNLKLQKSEMIEAKTFLPKDIECIRNSTLPRDEHGTSAETKITVSHYDSFTAAIRMKRETQSDVLVLNFANHINRGGGVYDGSTAQEEDLCRKSTLIKSLESDSAAPYYDYNKEHDNYLSSDALIISPNVEVIKDNNAQLLDDSVILSVVTCPAPLFMFRPCNFNFGEYRYTFYRRIEGILLVAAELGYRNLILGAFGCGAFKNDPKLVSALFKEVFENFRYKDKGFNDLFDNVKFAIRTDKEYPSRNYIEFSKLF